LHNFIYYISFSAVL